MFKSQLQKAKVLAYLTWFCAKLSLYPTQNLQLVLIGLHKVSYYVVVTALIHMCSNLR